MEKNKLTLAQKSWYKLDNAAKIFPGQMTETWSNVIRISVNLTEEVDPELLHRALLDILPRFPTVDVQIKRGIFWYYFEKNEAEPAVYPDSNNQCLRFKFSENSHFLFRVFYYRNRISLEIFHAVTDGFGASVFLNTLTAQYLRLKSYDIPVGGCVYDIHEEPKKEEFEDSFLKNATPKAKTARNKKAVYHRKANKLPAHMCRITSGYIPVDKLKEVSKSYGATITEYLTAVLLDVYLSLQKSEERKQRDVDIQVPVNARHHFDSKTLRNFSVCYEMRINPRLGEYTFPELVKQTSLYMRYINNPKTLGAMFASNIKLERSPFMRPLPLSIKNLGILTSFLLFTETTNTSLFTNLGRVVIPDEMMKYVESYILMPSPGVRNAGRIGAVSVGNVMTITFSNAFTDSDIEREFFTRLVKAGIHVKIESNY